MFLYVYICLYIFSLSVFYCRSMDFMSEINAFIHSFIHILLFLFAMSFELTGGQVVTSRLCLQY